MEKANNRTEIIIDRIEFFFIVFFLWVPRLVGTPHPYPLPDRERGLLHSKIISL